jgi:hypothetical protein
VAQLQATFDDALAQALRVDRLEPVPVPQQTVTQRVDVLSIEPVLSGLSETFPDTDLQLSFGPSGCAIEVGKPFQRSSRAATLQEALTPLVAQLIEAEPEPDQLRRLLLLLLDENPQLERLESLADGLPGRFHFGLALIGLLKCLFRERFGPSPERAVLEEFAAETYQEALGLPIEDDESRPEAAVYSQLLAAIADPADPAWRQLQLMEQLSAILDVLARLIRDRRQTGAVTSELDDLLVGQAVEQGLLMARAVTGTGDGKRGAS